MLSPQENDAVVNHIVRCSRRPLVAVRLWSLCICYLDRRTGEIQLSREEIAVCLGQRSAEVSELVSELVRAGVLERRRVPVPGLRGRGVVKYYCNPRVATHLRGGERDTAQSSAPRLRVVTVAGAAVDCATA